MGKYKYIDADKLIAEIKRLKEPYRPYLSDCEGDYEIGWREGCNNALDGILSFIDSLQQEQPEVDIRKELDGLELMGSNDARDIQTIARHFYELGLKARKEK